MSTEPRQITPKLSIQIPTHRAWNAFFAASMVMLTKHLAKIGIDFDVSIEIGVSNLTGGRERRVADAIKSNATHLLFLDDDMTFNQDVVEKMFMASNKLILSGERKVAIGVNPCRKSPVSLAYTARGLDGKFVESKGKTGLVEVERCGLSVFLIETNILRELKPPFFEITWDAERGEHQGEDFYFCQKLRNSGVKIFIDQDISQSIGHAGDYIYGYNSYPDDGSQTIYDNEIKIDAPQA